jgi:hypothetical protein
MMKPVSICAFLAMVAAASPAFADDATTIRLTPAGPSQIIPGAMLATAQSADSTPNRLVIGGGFMAGLLSNSSVFATRSVEVGVADWSGGRYQVNVTLGPSLFGGMSSEVGASAGAMPGDPGTTYGLHLGTGWAEGVATNPTGARSGFGGAPASPTDVNLSFTVNHALTSQLSLMGAAEARHEIGGQLDGATGPMDVVFGAGLGLRF